MEIIQQYIIPVAMGVSLSACCGFRVFVPLLIGGLAAKAGYLPLSSGFEWLGSWPAIICFAAASVAEIASYYIPVVDNILDTITTPSAVVTGTVLSASVFTEFDPTTKWILAAIAGGGAAGMIQAGTGLLRLGSTKLTAGVGNHAVSTAENAFSVGGSILALLLPVIMFVVIVVAVIVVIYYLLFRRRKAKA